MWGKPTLINNVETYANVAPIIAKGGYWYAKIRPEKSKGEKVFAIYGRVTHTGMLQSAVGFTLW